MVPSTNKLTEMRALAIEQEESRLRPALNSKSMLVRFLIRLRMKRRIEKRLKSLLEPEYYVLRNLENGDLPDTVIH